jgi:DNA modification methylase
VSVTILRANALELPLGDDTVDLVVTSPPYFGLRSYTDGGTHYDGQVGAEATPAEFVDALIAATRELARVVKPTGSIFVNLGDKYATPGSERSRNGEGARQTSRDGGLTRSKTYIGDVTLRRPDYGQVPPKSLLGIPWRYANRVVDELGLILRAEIVWSKPNGLPESVRDRVRRSHETWFHFTLRPNYYANVDEVREQYAPDTAARYAAGYNPRAVDAARPSVNTKLGGDTFAANPLGKLPGSVWTIATQPLRVPAELGVDHFAAYPMEWPRRLITGWSPPGICTACGEGRRAERDGAWHYQQPGNQHAKRALELAQAAGLSAEDVATRYGVTSSLSGNQSDGVQNVHPSTLELAEVLGGRLYAYQLQSLVKQGLGEYACDCPTPDAPTRPAVVLDPFGGTGTTALVADVLGRHGVHVDLSSDYCRLAQWRTTDPKQRARAARGPSTKAPAPAGPSHPYVTRRTARGRDSDPAPQQPAPEATLFDLLDGEAS